MFIMTAILLGVFLRVDAWQ